MAGGRPDRGAVRGRTRAAGLVALLLAGGTLLAADGAAAQEPETFVERYRELAQEPGLSDSTRLHRLFELDWERLMTWFPEFASRIGHPDADHGAWTDMSLAAIEAREERRGDAMPVLEKIDREALSPEARLNYDLFRRDLELDLASSRFPIHLLAVSQLGGFHQSMPSQLVSMPTRTVSDYEAILDRLRAAPERIEQEIALLREGIERGVTQPAVPLRDVPSQVDNLIVEAEPDGEPAALTSPLLKPFREMPETIPEPERERLRWEAIAVYEEGIVPALHRLRDFLADEYLPAAREEIAATALPDGKAWYAFDVRRRTTTELTPEEIHEIGLAEVRRIRAEMERIVRETGFEGSFDDFLEFLRTDPRFFHDSTDELLEGYRDIAKRADPELVKLFGRLPRLPYGVKAVPAYAEKSQTTAYYQRGSAEAGRPGWFFANTYALDTRPTWEMEALTLHEAVPGHHLQISIAQELEDVPTFRRHTGPTAFVEGWGLYAESLGGEMGLYEDPYSEFGRLTYEMWRAVRLVVDTGMHTLGWSRQRAIDFFAENSSKPLHDIEVEIDRYIVWPGQALAYKIGELKIKELRALAREELGEAFDVRAFHDVVLGAGALPLDVLERRVRAWIDRREAARPDP